MQARPEAKLLKDSCTLADVQQLLLWALGDGVCPSTAFISVRCPLSIKSRKCVRTLHIHSAWQKLQLLAVCSQLETCKQTIA